MPLAVVPRFARTQASRVLDLPGRLSWRFHFASLPLRGAPGLAPVGLHFLLSWENRLAPAPQWEEVALVSHARLLRTCLDDTWPVGHVYDPSSPANRGQSRGKVLQGAATVMPSGTDCNRFPSTALFPNHARVARHPASRRGAILNFLNATAWTKRARFFQ
jgi:hypothetical protein